MYPLPYPFATIWLFYLAIALILTLRVRLRVKVTILHINAICSHRAPVSASQATQEMVQHVLKLILV